MPSFFYKIYFKHFLGISPILELHPVQSVPENQHLTNVYR